MPTEFTREQLFADLEDDELAIDAITIKRAKIGDGDAMWNIGLYYKNNKQQDDKAMAWYRLAAEKNISEAQLKMGNLYYYGEGVPVDYLVAIDWYLKAAIQNNREAWKNIAGLFKNGRGVPVDKYKPLEWYSKHGGCATMVRELKNEGFHRTQQDKNKSIKQLLRETKIILAEAKRNAGVEQSSNENENDSNPRSLQAIIEYMQQQLDNKQESIEQYKRKVGETANEIQSLKKMNGTLEAQLGIKNNEVAHLETEIKQLRSASAIPLQSTNTRIKELEKSNQNYETLLGQERKFKDNQIELVKQKMEMSLEVEKKMRNEVERKYKAVKRELHNIKISSRENVSAYQKSIQIKIDEAGSTKGSSSNKTDYDMEDDNNGSDNNDINYDTPDEDSGDENDLKYDSDDQRNSSKKVPSS